jgi:hypothetical protein
MNPVGFLNPEVFYMVFSSQLTILNDINIIYQFLRFEDFEDFEQFRTLNYTNTNVYKYTSTTFELYQFCFVERGLLNS